jgi:D-amino-acid oxidase
MKIVIIGAGVSGLTTAYMVKERYPNSEVIIIGSKFGERTTSTVAGALWEWQPAVCGFFENLGSDINKRDNEWALSSYQKFHELKHDYTSGVYWRRVNFYLTEETELEREKINQLAQFVIGFDDDSSQIFKKNNINAEENGLYRAYSYVTPMVDTSVYINWLVNNLLNRGKTTIVSKEISSIYQVVNEYYPDLIFNCAGLDNYHLINDKDCIPVQGGWILYDNQTERVQEAHCTTIQENKDGGSFLFIVPRGNDKLIVGGFAKAEDWTTDLTLDNPLFMKIIEQNSRLLPWLRETEPITHRVGLGV